MVRAIYVVTGIQHDGQFQKVIQLWPDKGHILLGLLTSFNMRVYFFNFLAIPIVYYRRNVLIKIRVCIDSESPCIRLNYIKNCVLRKHVCLHVFKFHIIVHALRAYNNETKSSISIVTTTNI